MTQWETCPQFIATLLTVTRIGHHVSGQRSWADRVAHDGLFS